jgi:hypothetical protein
MPLENLLKVIEFLVPVAKAIPILGSSVEGSLEAVKEIVVLAQVRRASAARDLGLIGRNRTSRIISRTQETLHKRLRDGSTPSCSSSRVRIKTRWMAQS